MSDPTRAMSPSPARVLVSACLLGEPVRWDGTAAPLASDVLDAWRADGRVVPVCPELLGGLATPREPCEIAAGRVLDRTGVDRTASFEAGAAETLRIARESGACVAVLKDRSPSCGCRHIHDGSFSGRVIPGRGLTAELLLASGIAVFAQDELAAANAALEAGQVPDAG